jgi:hypothetical protein
MVFDGEHLSPYERGLLDDLHRANRQHAAARVTAGEGGGQPEPEMEGTVVGTRHGGRGRSRRSLAALGIVLFVAFVAVAALVGRGSGNENANVVLPPTPSDGSSASAPDTGAASVDAGAQVSAALARTTAAGTFHTVYHLTSKPPASPTAADCALYGPPPTDGSGRIIAFSVPAPIDPKELGSAGTRLPITVTTRAVPAVCASSDPTTADAAGEGTVDLDAKQMKVTAVTGGLNVGLRVDGDQIWETDASDITKPLGPGPGPGTLLSGFASTVEGTIGKRSGALAMTRLASPNGYLALDASEIVGAAPAGTATVNGIAVTNYDVEEDVKQLLSIPGLSANQTKTIQDAIDLLDTQRLTGTKVRVSIDDAGFIRQLDSVSHFADGGTSQFTATYDSFTCPGSAGKASTTTQPGDITTCPTNPTTTAAPAPGSSASTPTTTMPTSMAPAASSTTASTTSSTASSLSSPTSTAAPAPTAGAAPKPPSTPGPSGGSGGSSPG